MNKKMILSIAAALIMALPVTAVAWSNGDDRVNEPDTPYDAAPYAWTGSPSGAAHQIYLNGFLKSSDASGAATVQPGMLGARFAGFVLWREAAWLGYWRDCNGDNFIGLSTTGGSGYLISQAPAAAAACPSMPYNDGTFIHEFIWIGWKTGEDPVSSDPYKNVPVFSDGTVYAVTDNTARIWYDFNLPWDVPASTVGLFPLPPGTLDTASTVAEYLRNYILPIDVEDAVDSNTAPGTFGTAYGPVMTAGNLVPVGIVRDRYNDSKTPESTRGSRFVQVWDCASPGGTAGVLPGTNPQANPDGGLGSGSIEPTIEEVTAPWVDPLGPDPVGRLQGCRYRNPTYGNTELYVQAASTQKDQNDDRMAYIKGRQTKSPVPGAGSPIDGGLVTPPTTTANARMQPAWNGRFLWSTIGAVPGSTERDYGTWYAHVGAEAFTHPTAVALFGAGGASAATALPSGTATFRYGSDHCTEDGAEITGSWSCDETLWAAASADAGCQSNAIVGTSGRICAVVGQAYNLRDIDCRDTSFAGLRVKTPDPIEFALNAPDAVADTQAFADYVVDSFDPTNPNGPNNPAC